MHQVKQPVKVLEVIVTSLQEAIEAEAGGADRLELVRSLAEGGLTPNLDLIRRVKDAVSIPVRVMIRENGCMTVLNRAELDLLKAQAKAISGMGIDGLVLGWVRNNLVDTIALEAVIEAGSTCPVTFHRAIEEVFNPIAAIETLKKYPQVDRILTSGGPGSWTQRRSLLLGLRRAAAPEIEIIVGGGLSKAIIVELINGSDFCEVHVGRAVRTPHEYSGVIHRHQVALLKTVR